MRVCLVVAIGLTLGCVEADDVEPQPPAVADLAFVRGDLDGNGSVDLDDLAAFDAAVAGKGVGSRCFDVADVDDDGEVDELDRVRLRDFVSDAGPPPAAPFPDAGFDPSLTDAFFCGDLCARVEFVRGDANGDGIVDETDWAKLLAYLHVDDAEVVCPAWLDVDDDGDVDERDLDFLTGYLWSGTAAPPAPFPRAGQDPTP